MGALALSAGLWAAAAAQGTGAQEHLLKPEAAFQFEAHPNAPDKLIATWDIAEGYYLYRDKFKFKTETPGYRLGAPEFPQGEIKEDAFFGRMEIFREAVTVTVPVQREAGAPPTLALRAVSQGCADLGVCYPPLTQTAALDLPPVAASADAPPSTPAAGVSAEGAPAPGARNADARAADDPFAALSSLSELGEETEFLDPDQAFEFSAATQDPTTLIARWNIAKDYYLYRDKFKFSLQDASGVRLGEIELPRGQVKEDEFFGRVETLRGTLAVPLPLARDNLQSQPVKLVAQYQGCADAGLCYPPTIKEVKLTLPPLTAAGTGGQSSTTAAPATQAAPAKPPDTQALGTVLDEPLPAQSEQDRLAARLASGSIWLNILAFFGAGLLLAFTPCVFPMIPILSGIIVGQGKSLTTGRAFTLSLAFVLAMAVTYTVAGVIVGLSGENVQAVFQNPWVISIFAGIFVLLALSMFGFYELQMPSSVQSRLAELSNRQEGGTFIGAGIMGFLSALIVGPCVTAPLIGALIYIAQTGDAVLGGVALFALSLGMGAPLLLIGTSAGKLLPRAGGWMEITKAVFGVLLLGVAIWLLERILPTAIIMALWGLLLIVSAIYLRAFDGIREQASGWFRLWKGVGIAMAVYGALLLVGAAGGGNSLLQPLKGVLAGGGSGVQQEGLAFQQVKGVAGVEQAVARAAAENRPVMLDFYADWCVSCKEMEKYTFSNPAVQAALEQAIMLQVDVTANDAQDRELLKRYGLFGPPAILFFSPEGEEQRAARVVGFVPAERFAQHVNQALNNTQVSQR